MILPRGSLGFCAMMLMLAWYRLELCLFFLLCVFVHELGHLIALKFRNVPIYGFYLRLSGAVIEAGEMSNGTEFICVLAGPVFSLLFGAFILKICPECGLISICLGVINLLPMLPLDGGKMLHAILSMYFTTDLVNLILHICAFIVSGALMIGACWAAIWLQAGMWPIFAALVLLWRSGDMEK